MGEWMEQNCGRERGSFITGRSVHNQRIERLWLDVRLAVLDKYRGLFQQMEEDGLLDHENDLHLLVLQHVYRPLIQETLDRFRRAWNCHRIRTENSRTPEQIWLRGAMTAGAFGFQSPDPHPVDSFFGTGGKY